MASTVSNAKDNFKVVVKSRPLIKRERDARLSSQWKISGDSIESINPLITQRYTFDHIYGENSTTQELYDQVALPIVQKSVQGFNGTIFAYGQTSSGKTYTMLGDKKNPGIIRLAARQIFNDIMQYQQERTFIVRVNYLEIYNEKVYDLLNDRKEIKIQEFPNGELKFGCTGQKVQHEDDILKLVDAGNNHRKVAETNMNVQSSRSHAILQVGIESILECDGASQVSVLNMVDLAGSERADSTGAVGERLKEAGNINKSLLTLSLVINKLSEDPDGHICYRDSKLTRMLQTSLGGNSMTVMICAITPAAGEETNLTLGFATRAKKIENKPVINETVSDAVEVKRLKRTIVKLEEQLASQGKEIVEFQQRTNDLKFLKQITIQAPKHKAISGSQRRKTWAPGFDMPCALEPVIECPEIEAKKIDEKKLHEAVNFNRPIYLMFGDEGREVQCSEEDFESFLNDTIGKHIVDFEADDDMLAAQTVLSFPSRPSSRQGMEPEIRVTETTVKDPMYLTPVTAKTVVQQSRKSLLKTPKSLKFILGKNEQTPVMASLVASPIALDKDKRIRALEEELEELRHFQQTEAMIHSSQTTNVQAELKQKSVEISNLNEKLSDTLVQMNKIKEQFEAAQLESKEANKERVVAVKAKVVAEQNMAGIEFEYAQHKTKASRREQELVEQLQSLGNDDTVKVLKEKLATVTEKATSLETKLWQDEERHKSEIEKLNGNLLDQYEKFNDVSRKVNKLQNLQNEYDEISMQLVEFIQENDQLKSECNALKTTVGNLNAEINGLKAQQSIIAANSDIQADLYSQIRAHEHEIERLKEDLGMEMADHKATLEKTNGDLQAEHRKQIEAYVLEIESLKENLASATEEAIFLEAQHKTEIEKLNANLLEENEKFNNVSEQVVKFQNIQSEYDEVSAQLTGSVQENGQLKNECNDLKTTVDNLNAEINDLKAQHSIIATNSDIQAELQKQIQAHELEVESLKEKLTSAIEKGISLEAQYETEIEKLKANLLEEHDKFNNVSEQVDKLQNIQSEYDEVSTQLADSVQENGQLKNECNGLRTTIDNLNAEINVLKAKQLIIAANSDIQAELQKQIQAHELEIEQLKQKVTSETEKATSLEVQLSQNEKRHKSEIEKLNANLLEEHEKFNNVSEQVDKLQKLQSNHQVELNALKAKQNEELDELRQDRDVRLDIIQQLKQTIAEQKNEIVKLKTAHDNLLSEVSQLQHANNLMQNACAQARIVGECLTKELEVLKRGYSELKMNTAEQELEQLKLQKTIDDTINCSMFNDTTNNENAAKSNQKAAEGEAKDPRKSTTQVRKIKRQSIHDDTRRLSGYDCNMIECGIQTDPVSEICACAEMAKQIKQLKQENIIIEAKYETFKRYTGVNQLNEEIKKLKGELSMATSKWDRLNYDYEDLVDKHEKLKVKSVIAQQKPPSTDAAIQTEAPQIAASFVDQMDWDHVNRRVDKYKKGYEDTYAAYKKIKVDFDQMKTELEEKSAKCVELAEFMEEIKPKYSNMKRLCNHRYDQITEFKNRIAEFEKNEIEFKKQIETLNASLVTFNETSTELTRFKQKYEVAKQICDSRRLEITRLNQIIKGIGQNNENVPVNK